MDFKNIPWLRTILYVLSISFAVASVFVAVNFPEFGAAFATASGILATAAGTASLSNLTPKSVSRSEFASQVPIVPITASNVDDDVSSDLTALFERTINSPSGIVANTVVYGDTFVEAPEETEEPEELHEIVNHFPDGLADEEV